MLRPRAQWLKLPSPLFHLKPARTRSLATQISRPRPGDTIVIAMSGGVDSSVTASLLAQHETSYDLKAVFMRNWDTRDEHANDTGCEWEKDWEDVRRVCGVLGVPCEMVSKSLVIERSEMD